MPTPRACATWTLTCLTAMTLACGDSSGDSTGTGSGTGSETADDSSGDGDGDTGDGDGDTGDGDGDSGDGDGDTSGDGDGDTSGDGDGDTSGDGDGDGDTSGDGDGDGDTGDGDGDGDPGFDCDPNLDPILLTLEGGQSARYPTIADAVFAAPDDSLVQICPGTYDESVTVDDNIEIQGAGPDQTIWEPADGAALFLDADDVTVRDLQITGGTGTMAPGFGTTCGGAIFVEDNTNAPRQVLLANLVIDDNSAELGGGICIAGTSYGAVPTVTIEDSSITNNTAVLEGGGLLVHGRIHLINTAVVGNTAELQGGGGLNFDYGCQTLDQCSITDSVVQSNTAAVGMWSNGGGMWLGGFNKNGPQGVAITVTNSDFGFGFDEENQPDDVFTIFNLMPASYGFYANGVSFTCEDGICTDP